MTDKYKNNYLRLIKQYISGNNQCFPKHKVFEILSAIDLDMILWDDLPPDFDTKFNVPHKMDYGVDLITLEYDKCCQVKLYNENSRITWTDISKYYAYSKGILKIDNMILYKKNEPKIDKMGEKLIQNNNIQVIRKEDFDDLIDKYSTDINRIDCSTSSSTSSSSLEERHYLLECYKIFNESTESQLYFQLPCGTGKSYIMLYILSKYIQEHPESRHIIFCPWIDLAKQTYELFVTNNIKTDFIGDGKHSITEASNVIVCINMSVSHIPSDIEITYKIIDEAHHLESEDSQIRKQINKLQCIKELNLSATFHNQECLDFNYPMNEAIEDGYISDYQMVIGYFESGDKTDELVSLIKNHTEWSPMFVYFNTTEKCKVFNDKLKQVNIKSTYITGDTPSIEREQTKTDIESDKLQVVCLCGVYNEGVSIDCLQTVVFGDLRHSQINKIQIAMRANRKHSCKPFYRVVLPVVESDFSEKDIQELIRTFAEIDTRLVEDIRNKNQLRVKLIMNDGSNEANLENAELLYEQVYDRMGVMIEGMSAEEIWFMKFEMLKEFIDKNKFTPLNKRSKLTDEYSLSIWFSNQKQNYKKKNGIMKLNTIIYDIWSKFIINPQYINYFKSNEEKWFMKLDELKEFINSNKMRPTDHSNHIGEKQCGKWLSHQITNYKTERMQPEILYNSWTEFINDPIYIGYFKSNEEIWYENLEKVKEFIDINSKIPNVEIGLTNKKQKRQLTDKEDIERKLGNWICSQKNNYKHKHKSILIDNNDIYNHWVEFINNPKYINYFKNKGEIWNDNFTNLKLFIDSNNKLPNADIGRIKKDGKRITIKLDTTKNMEKQLGSFLGTNKENYEYKKNIMKTDITKYELWKNFIENDKYCDYFKSNEELWYIKYNELKELVNNNQKLSSDILINWHRAQNQNYKNKTNIIGNNSEIYKCWGEFIGNSNYINYFKPIDMIWDENLNKLKEFIDVNKKLPTHSQTTKGKNIDEINLGSWVNTQRGNYKNNKHNMKSDVNIYNKWNDFIENDMYSNYFKTNEELWFENFNTLKQYIDDNNKLPSHLIYERGTRLGSWLSHQKQNYENKKLIMKTNNEINKCWSEFINDPLYIDYFKTDVEIWYDSLNKLKQCIDNNNKLPVSTDINNATLSNWLSMQKQKYKNKRLLMKTNKDIYNSWTEFINDPKYIDYFKTNEELWFENLNKLKEFITINNKRPQSSKNIEIQEKTIGQWLATQVTNHKKKNKIMKDEKIYNTWTRFITDYSQYF